MINKLFNSDKYIRVNLTIIASCIFLVCLFALSMISYALISDIYYDDTEISPTEKHRIQHQEEAEKLDEIIRNTADTAYHPSCSNKMGNVGAIAIANSPYLKNLTALSIWRNEIRDEGGQAIAESETFLNLDRLYMSLNYIERPTRKVIRGSDLAKRLTTLVMD